MADILYQSGESCSVFSYTRAESPLGKAGPSETIRKEKKDMISWACRERVPWRSISAPAEKVVWMR